MTIAILLRPLEELECKELLLKQQSSGLKIITENQEYIPSKFGQLDVNVKPLTKKDNEYFYSSLMKRVIELGHKEFKGSSIAKILKDEYSSFWYYLRFALFHRSLNDFKLAYFVQNIFKNEKATSYTIYASTKKFQSLIPSEVNFNLLLNERSEKTEGGFLLKYVAIFLIRSLRGLFQKGLSNRKGKHMLVLSQDKQDVLNLQSLSVEKGDPHLSYLSDMAVTDDDFLFLSQLKPPGKADNHKLEWSVAFESKYPGKTILFEKYLLKTLFTSSFYNSIKRIPSLFEQIKVKCVNTSIEDQYLIEKLISLKQLLYLAVHHEISAKSLFKNSSLNSVGGVNEHALEMRSILKEGKLQGYETFGIQHGGISANNIFYSFYKGDQPYKPWPDYSLLRGNYNKEMLISQNAMPESSLKVLGHMRTDAIEALKDFKAKDLFPDLKANSKIIVYATQGFPLSERSTIQTQIKDVFRLMKELSDYELVIKPHPNETDFDYYSKVAEECNFSRYRIFQGDLYQLLAASNVVITYYSTVGTEAVYFDKPLIVMDYTERDAQGFLKAEVGMKVTNENELKTSILNPSRAKEESRNTFISNRAFMIDGNCTNRYYDFISSLGK